MAVITAAKNFGKTIQKYLENYSVRNICILVISYQQNLIELYKR